MDTIKDTSSTKIFPPVYPKKSYNKHPYLVIVRVPPPSPMLEMPISILSHPALAEIYSPLPMRKLINLISGRAFLQNCCQIPREHYAS